MQMVGPWGRYLPQWLRAPGNGSGPAICQHTHTHTHWTLPTTMSVLETPFDIHVSSVYQTHTCMQASIPTLCILAKKTPLCPGQVYQSFAVELRCHATALIIVKNEFDIFTSDGYIDVSFSFYTYGQLCRISSKSMHIISLFCKCRQTYQ